MTVRERTSSIPPAVAPFCSGELALRVRGTINSALQESVVSAGILLSLVARIAAGGACR